MLKKLALAFSLACAPAALAENGHEDHAPDSHDAHPAAPAAHTASAPAPAHGWSYTGPSGPQSWGRNDAENALCAVGAQQSPIDLAQAVPAFTASPQLEWKTVHSGEVVNNGHTLQMNLENAGGMIRNGKIYELIQFHFHTPSEHTIDGQHFPMEAHFVHKANDGTLAVIGVMFVEGANNATLDPIWWTAPGVPGKAAVNFELDPEDLLPINRASYAYQGSLTTPPCSEIVDWTVMKTPLTASKSQITVFKSLFGENARPVQPLNRRFVLATPQ